MIRQISIVSVVLGELLDKALFIPLVVLLVVTLDQQSTLFSMVALAAGASCTLAGSYYAARRAGRLFVAHALVVAAITFALSLARFVVVQLGDEPSVHPIWWEFLAWSATFAAGYFGGALARARARRDVSVN